MSAPTERTATCMCGAFEATARGEPDITAMCSCLACQRRSGTAFGLYAWWPEAAVSMRGEANRYGRRSDRGRTFEHHFCPTCGSTVVLRGDHLPGRTGIAVGAFADPDFPPPTVAVWDTTRHKWLDDLDKLPRLPEQRT